MLGVALGYLRALGGDRGDALWLGVDFRPVPAVVLSAMWYENERLVGDHWLFGLGVEIPFSISDRGSSGGFWKNVKNAFKPRRRHLAERLIEPSRRNTLPMQIGTSRQKVETQITYTATIILPDGRVVEVSGQGPVITDSFGNGTGSGAGGNGGQSDRTTIIGEFRPTSFSLDYVLDHLNQSIPPPLALPTTPDLAPDLDTLLGSFDILDFGTWGTWVNPFPPYNPCNSFASDPIGWYVTYGLYYDLYCL